MGVLKKLSSSSLAALVIASATTAHALDETSPAVVENKGTQLTFSPVLLVPLSARPVGGGVDLEVRYGIPADPMIVAPGGRVAGYFLSGHVIFTGMPVVRLTLPTMPVAPYLTAGLGIGVVTSSTDEGADKLTATGLAVMGGGGFMVHVSRAFGIGTEVTYQTITSSDFSALAFGLALIIGL